MNDDWWRHHIDNGRTQVTTVMGSEFAHAAASIIRERLLDRRHGCWDQWNDGVSALPDVAATMVCTDGVVSVQSKIDSSIDGISLRRALMSLHPWRKGPFNFFGVEVDAEWRSDQKWTRVADDIDFDGRRILDVGGGNGYFGWRMVDAGARSVATMDTTPLFAAQFASIARYMDGRHQFLCGRDEEFPSSVHPGMDICVSMGVLYHVRSPVDHLRRLFGWTRRGGRLLLETMFVDGEASMLIPPNRYARMRNVWMIPSIDVIANMMRRCGWDQIEILDRSATTINEQRRTEWMQFESLSCGVRGDPPEATIEGLPPPKRVVLTAVRPC